MNLTVEQIESLQVMLGKTREKEFNCNECLDLVGEYAEFELQGKAIPHALEAVQHHLSLCGECREEYESLLAALKAIMADEDNQQ